MSEILQPERNYLHELKGGYAELSEEGRNAYHAGRIARIQEGKPTWMAQNLTSDGYCFVYWFDKEPVAQLHLGGWDEDHSVYFLSPELQGEWFQFETVAEGVEKTEDIVRRYNQPRRSVGRKILDLVGLKTVQETT